MTTLDYNLLNILCILISYIGIFFRNIFINIFKKNYLEDSDYNFTTNTDRNDYFNDKINNN